MLKELTIKHQENGYQSLDSSEQSSIPENTSPFTHSISETLTTFYTLREEMGLTSVDIVGYAEGTISIHEIMQFFKDQGTSDPDIPYLQYTLPYYDQDTEQNTVSVEQDKKDRISMLSFLRQRLAKLDSDADKYILNQEEVPQLLRRNASSYEKCIQMLSSLQPKNTINVLTADEEWLPMLKEDYDAWIADGGIPPITVAEE